uniref:HAT C-terminal dimerisation domain-containing protein n=1 Tax=Brassica oleracea var. oleracea TaxID=109376 RepID=A0A0D3CFW7_BRAOL
MHFAVLAENVHFCVFDAKSAFFCLNYDVLSWWKRNSSKYPILSEFARDVVAIQMVEALVCSQQWIRSSISDAKLASLVQIFEQLAFHDGLEAESTA